MPRLKRSYPQDGQLIKLLSSELEVHLEYQSIIKSNSEVPDIDWLINLRHRRREVLSSLADNFSFIGKNGSSFANCSPKANGSTEDTVKYLLDVEKNHISRLERLSQDYYISPEWKKLISERLLPIANGNIAELSSKFTS